MPVSSSPEGRLFLGVDVGGTFIKFTDGKRTWKEKTPDGVEELLSLIVQTLKENSVKRAGIGVAGLVRVEKGVITDSPNLRFLKGLELKREIEGRAGVEVLVLNDATAAAYGEFKLGAGRGSSHLLCLTLGTGLGGGAVVNGKPLIGASGAALEVGHMVVERNGELCRCGRRGCLEAYVSSYGLERLYFRKTGKSLSSFEIVERAKLGEEEARKALLEMASYLSFGVMNLLHIFNPDVVVVSGGIPARYPELLNSVERKVREMAFSQPASDFRLKPARLGEFSGATGALLAAKELIY